MSVPYCDHSSVGILVWRNERLLLIERKRKPFGFAPPAGHVDDHGTFEDAARRELFEEVGIEANRIELVAEGYRENRCRRPRGTWHYWKIYHADAEGTVQTADDEVLSHRWCNTDELSRLAAKAVAHRKQGSPEADIKADPGLEDVWLDWLVQIGVIGNPDLTDRKKT